MRRPLACALVALLAGCGQTESVLRPIIDAPDPGTEAYPYAGLTSLVLLADHGGEENRVTIDIGDPLELPDVPFGDDLVIHMSGLAGETETAYGRTCAFDLTRESLAEDPEIHLYLSRIVKWASETLEIESGQSGVQSYTLPGGRGAFVGGLPSPMAGRFDPEDGAFVDLRGDLPAPLEARAGAALAPLADGRALLIGGVDGDEGIPVVEVVDPRPPDDGLGPAGPLEVVDGPRLRGHAAATLVDGTVLVVGGEEQEEAGGTFAPAARTAWQLEFGEGGVLDPPRRLGIQATFARAGHTMTRLGDEAGADVLIVGGRDETGAPVAQAELYRPLQDAFEIVDGAVLAVPRWGHTAVRLPGGFVLIIGGFTQAMGQAQPVPVSTLELYDPGQGEFTLAGELGPEDGLSEMSVSRLPDGTVLLAGGINAAGEKVAKASKLFLDTLSGMVIVNDTDSLAVPRAGHGAAVLCDGTVLVVGGTDDPEAPVAERYNPSSANRR